MIARFLGALQFLTIVPVRAGTPSLARSAVFFPMIGALLGATAGALLLLTNRSLSALLALAFLLTVTGCLHEDGLADVADAVRACRTREKILAILKDSRIGTYGAVALIVSILIRWQTLVLCRINPVYGVAAALALSRTSLVALAAFAPPVGDGLGRSFAQGLTRPILIVTLAQGIVLAFLAGWHEAAAMISSTATILWLSRTWFTRHLGGVNGDCLGATCQVVETVNLVILAWQPSF